MKRLPNARNRLPYFSPSEAFLIAICACCTGFFLLTQVEIGVLTLVGVAAAIMLYKVWEAIPALRKPSILGICGSVLSLLWVARASLPAQALLNNVEGAIVTLLTPTGVDVNIIPLVFTIIDLFIVFVLIGSIAFAIYQGSQSNDIRPILFVIAFIVGGVLVLEIGSALILS